MALKAVQDPQDVAQKVLRPRLCRTLLVSLPHPLAAPRRPSLSLSPRLCLACSLPLSLPFLAGRVVWLCVRVFVYM
jgi:hypothetical protein